MKLMSNDTWAARYDAAHGRTGSGTVMLVAEIGWGVSREAVRITDARALCDARLYSDAAVTAIGDILMNAEAVVYCRPEGGEFASCSFGHARFSGSAGNRISVAVLSGGDEFTVNTFVDGIIVSSQTVHRGDVPSDNDYVIFASDCELTPTAGMPMTGGTDAVLTDEEYGICLGILADSAFDGDVLMCGESEEARISSFLAALTSNRVGGGVLRGVMLNDAPVADEDVARAVTSVYCVGEEGRGMIYYLSGLLARLPFYASAVGHKYEGALPYYACDELVAAALPHNKLLLVERGGEAYVYCDCNVSVGVYSDNVKSKICDEVKKRINALFHNRFYGKIKADGVGFALLRDGVVDILRKLDEKYGVIDLSSSTVDVCADGDGGVYVTAAILCDRRPTEIRIGITVH